jgi:hypothetical protein
VGSHNLTLKHGSRTCLRTWRPRSFLKNDWCSLDFGHAKHSGGNRVRNRVGDLLLVRGIKHHFSERQLRQEAVNTLNSATSRAKRVTANERRTQPEKVYWAWSVFVYIRAASSPGRSPLKKRFHGLLPHRLDSIKCQVRRHSSPHFSFFLFTYTFHRQLAAAYHSFTMNKVHWT